MSGYEDLWEKLFNGTLPGGEYRRGSSGEKEINLCRRMCMAMKRQGMKLRWREIGLDGWRLQFRETNGTMREGPTGQTKREAMVGLARQVMK
jgi:hypothetical protein